MMMILYPCATFCILASAMPVWQDPEGPLFSINSPNLLTVNTLDLRAISQKKGKHFPLSPKSAGRWKKALTKTFSP
jgi:hypothetical protein